MRQRLQTYALTAVTHQRRRSFQRTLVADLFITTLFRYRDEGRFLLHAFVGMPDHIHILITPSSNDPVERCAQLIKAASPSPHAKINPEKSGKMATTPIA